MNKCKICKKEHSRFYICDLDKQRKEELNQLYIESENDFNKEYIINKYMYTPTVEDLLIALIKGIDVYEVSSGSVIKLDKYNIVESLYTFIQSNDWEENDNYSGHKINIYNYQLEVPDNIDIDDLRLTDKLENRFNYE